MMPVDVKIVNTSNNPLPEYATGGSSGMDIRAGLSAPVMLKPLERSLLPTGLFIEMPEGFEAQIRPRSGLAVKQGITNGMKQNVCITVSNRTFMMWNSDPANK